MSTTRGLLLAAVCVVLPGGAARAQHEAGHEHAAPASPPAAATPTAPAPRDPSLPPGNDDAKAQLERSPRHGEYVDVKLAGSQVQIRSYVVYPERKDKAPAVIVIHDIGGLGDWVRAVADQLARDGFIALVPDLVSGLGPNGGGSDAFSSRDDVVKAIRGLALDEQVRRLEAVRDYALKLPAASGKTATVGFCWGGSASFAYATRQPGLNAAVVYYGTAPETPTLASVKAPVLGLYGGDDARVNATIEPAAAELKRLGRTFEYELYEGAGHGFLKSQGEREGANLRATQKAWPRTLAFLRKHAS